MLFYTLYMYSAVEKQNFRYVSLPVDSNAISWTYSISNEEEQRPRRTNNKLKECLGVLVKKDNKKLKINQQRRHWMLIKIEKSTALYQ